MSAPKKPRRPLPEVRELPPKMIRELASYPCCCCTIKPDRRPCTSCVAKSVLKGQEAADAPKRP